MARPNRAAGLVGKAEGAPALDLLSSIAHELRAPLSSLTASAEMLPLAGDGERERFANIIQRQALRLSGIVEGLLDAYRAARGELKLVPEVVHARPFLRTLCEEQATLYPTHRFRAMAERRDELAADARLLAIVVGNLLSNAAKYSPAGSVVTARYRSDHDGRRIEVIDQGHGVAKQYRERIFERGVRATTSVPGDGLGLFISSQLCQAMGAELSLAHTSTGGGSCFVVHLGAAGRSR
jgi:signal transduction histidine kinase